jgi:hypothetical protein
MKYQNPTRLGECVDHCEKAFLIGNKGREARVLNGTSQAEVAQNGCVSSPSLRPLFARLTRQMPLGT